MARHHLPDNCRPPQDALQKPQDSNAYTAGWSYMGQSGRKLEPLTYFVTDMLYA